MVVIRSRKMICLSNYNSPKQRLRRLELLGELRSTTDPTLCSSILLNYCCLLTKSQRWSTHREESLLSYRWSVRDCRLWSEYLCIASERNLLARLQLLSTESSKYAQADRLTVLSSSRSLFRKVIRKNCSISVHAFLFFLLFHFVFFIFWLIMSAMVTWKMVLFH